MHQLMSSGPVGPVAGSHSLACPTRFAEGGLGKHFAQLVEQAAHDDGAEVRYYSRSAAHDQDHRANVIPSRVDRSSFDRLRRRAPSSLRPRLFVFASSDRFDRWVADELGAVGVFTGFAGMTLRSFEAARRTGAGQLRLASATSHVDQVREQHARAAAVTGIADTWLSGAEHDKALREYDLADIVLTNSAYTEASLRERGVPADRLQRTKLTVPDRFFPAKRVEDGVFRIAYVGRLEATKGVTLLLDAFDRLGIVDSELHLVGGFTSPAVRRHIQSRSVEDTRIRVGPRDPLPVLQQADVFVHPTFEDGLGLGPLEALATGVPTIVTGDTGMQEYVVDGVNGYVVPTGEIDPLVDTLREVCKAPLRSAYRLLPDDLVVHSNTPEQ